MIGGIVIVALMAYVGNEMRKCGMDTRMFNDNNRI